MTDNEIIKALKCLCGDEIPCNECAYTTDTLVCKKIVAIDALDLITRQQSEIERLQKDKSEWIHLPCKVGDTVFCFEPCFDKHYNQRFKIVEEKIIDIKTTATVLGLNFDVDKIGKTVFLTREEAEKALERELKKKK